MPLFITVPDVSACVEKAESLGATVIIPPGKLPDSDELAISRDPDGLSFGLMKTK